MFKFEQARHMSRQLTRKFHRKIDAINQATTHLEHALVVLEKAADNVEQAAMKVEPEFNKVTQAIMAGAGKEERQGEARMIWQRPESDHRAITWQPDGIPRPDWPTWHRQ